MTVESVFASLGWRILFLSRSAFSSWEQKPSVVIRRVILQCLAESCLFHVAVACIHGAFLHSAASFLLHFPLRGGRTGTRPHTHTRARERERASDSRTVQQQKANTQSPRATKENNQRKLTTNIAAHSTTPISKNGKKTSNEPKRRESSSGGS